MTLCLLFCTGLTRFSQIISKCGYICRFWGRPSNITSHLLYINDITVWAKNEQYMWTHWFTSLCNNCSFGLVKCIRMASWKKTKWKQLKEQGKSIRRQHCKSSKSQLKELDKVQPFNMYVLPGITYYTGRITWPKEEKETTDIKTKMLLTIQEVLHTMFSSLRTEGRRPGIKD